MTISCRELFWNSGTWEGREDKVQQIGNTLHLTISGETYQGNLSKNSREISWSDGDIWTKDVVKTFLLINSFLISEHPICGQKNKTQQNYPTCNFFCRPYCRKVLT